MKNKKREKLKKMLLIFCQELVDSLLALREQRKKLLLSKI